MTMLFQGMSVKFDIFQRTCFKEEEIEGTRCRIQTNDLTIRYKTLHDPCATTTAWEAKR